MATVYDHYTRELHKKFGYLATWAPNVKVALGDVGVLYRDRFERTTGLEPLGIKFDVRESAHPLDFEYTSSGSVEVDFGVQGKTQGVAEQLGPTSGKMSVSFSSGNALLFVAHNCTIASIDDVEQLGRSILRMYDTGDWEKTNVIVTEVVSAGSATILISSHGGARAELEASSQLGPQGLQLANLSANVKVVRLQGIGTHFVGESGLTPLFKAYGVRAPLFNQTKFEPKAFREPEYAEAPEFSEVGFDYQKSS